MKPIYLVLALALTLASCSPVGPDYVKPEFQPAANYKTSTSKQLGVSPSWWKAFRDPTLNSLQTQLLSKNYDLAAAYARRQQAFARLGLSKADASLQSSAGGDLTRRKTSRAGADAADAGEYFNLYQIGANFSYELDLWGRVRRLVEAGNADAQAAEYAVADVRAALQTQLARQYFALRFLDAEMATLAGTVKTRQANVKIAQDRLDAGFSTELDTARAKSELSTAKAELLALKGPRAQLENSIAVLLGRQPSGFRISSRNYTGYLPRVPAGLPVALLSRRPDVAVAERRLASATARIGAAELERFPKISLTGNGGSSSASSARFLDWISQFYSIGPSVSVPLFQGGRIRSNVLLSEGKRDEALANYKKTALSALADVESSLADLQVLRAEATARKNSVDAASHTYDLALLSYKEGTTSYLDVANAQRDKLIAQRASVRTRGRQFTATVQLIQALGGGFSKGSK